MPMIYAVKMAIEPDMLRGTPAQFLEVFAECERRYTLTSLHHEADYHLDSHYTVSVSFETVSYATMGATCTALRLFDELVSRGMADIDGLTSLSVDRTTRMANTPVLGATAVTYRKDTQMPKSLMRYITY